MQMIRLLFGAFVAVFCGSAVVKADGLAPPEVFSQVRKPRLPRSVCVVMQLLCLIDVGSR
jgi:hypothetical protein